MSISGFPTVSQLFEFSNQYDNQNNIFPEDASHVIRNQDDGASLIYSYIEGFAATGGPVVESAPTEGVLERVEPVLTEDELERGIRPPSLGVDLTKVQR